MAAWPSAGRSGSPKGPYSRRRHAFTPERPMGDAVPGSAMSTSPSPGRIDRRADAHVYGAGRDLSRTITTHLFVLSPNHGGSTFLQQALATSRATWNLPREGQAVHGFTGPATWRRVPRPGPAVPRWIWAAEQRWLDVLTDARAYDWPRTRQAWYFQAYARDPAASVFTTKSPPFLLNAGALARHFRNARFLFLVRNPYAVCESICRAWARSAPPGGLPVRDLPEAAARHVATCLAWQRRNVEAHRGRGLLFTYEAMCAEPERVAHEIRALVPELHDLNLRRRLVVKGYDEMLTDMNARQIARLDAGRFAAFNRVFRRRRDVLDSFGYDLVDGRR